MVLQAVWRVLQSLPSFPCTPSTYQVVLAIATGTRIRSRTDTSQREASLLFMASSLLSCKVFQGQGSVGSPTSAQECPPGISRCQDCRVRYEPFVLIVPQSSLPQAGVNTQISAS